MADFLNMALQIKEGSYVGTDCEISILCVSFVWANILDCHPRMEESRK